MDMLCGKGHFVEGIKFTKWLGSNVITETLNAKEVHPEKDLEACPSRACREKAAVWHGDAAGYTRSRQPSCLYWSPALPNSA